MKYVSNTGNCQNLINEIVGNGKERQLSEPNI